MAEEKITANKKIGEWRGRETGWTIHCRRITEKDNKPDVEICKNCVEVA